MVVKAMKVDEVTKGVIIDIEKISGNWILEDFLSCCLGIFFLAKFSLFFLFLKPDISEFI